MVKGSLPLLPCHPTSALILGGIGNRYTVRLPCLALRPDLGTAPDCSLLLFIHIAAANRPGARHTTQ